jgi:hypothetical protein
VTYGIAKRENYLLERALGDVVLNVRRDNWGRNMEFIQESITIWFICCLVLAGVLQIIAKNRTTDVQPGMATKSDQFSMKTVFFSIRSGEAPLFFTVLGITIFFFLFALALCKKFGLIVPF